MKKLFALAIAVGFFVFLPNASADSNGLSLQAPNQVRVPLNHSGPHLPLLTLSVDNIQVQEKWTVNSDVALTISNRVLILEEETANQNAIAATIMVEDRFSLLNAAYQNLTAVATIILNFTPRGDIVFNTARQLYILGGQNDAFDNLQDIWATPNDAQWVSLTVAAWMSRRSHQALTHNGSLYVLGGYQDGLVNDVWVLMTNDQSWRQLTPDAGWAARADHQVLSHQGTLYLLGGNNSNDVWVSADGVTWTEKSAAAWRERGNHQAVVHNGRLYVLGGNVSNTRANDVWSSADGVQWTQEKENSEDQWGRRSHHQAVSYNGRIYVLGGRDGGKYYDDVWSSADGRIWRLEKSLNSGNWDPLYDHRAAVFDGVLYVLGGRDSNGERNNKVWSSTDGGNWTEQNNNSWQARSRHAAVVFPPALALDGVGVKLSLAIGITENNLHTFTAQYGVGNYSYSLLPAVDGFAVAPDGVLAVTKDSLSLGEYTLTVYVEDDDGNRDQTAVRVQISNPLPITLPASPIIPAFAETTVDKIHTFIAYRGTPPRLYTLVGGDDNGYFAVDRESGDLAIDNAAAGVYILSIEASDSASPPDRTTTAATVMVQAAQRIFILGGNDGTLRNDQWTTDGLTWLSLTAAAWSARSGHQAVVHNSRVYILGGNDGAQNNQVWWSTDGRAWAGGNSAGWSARSSLQAVSHRGQIYVLGGNDGANKNDVWWSTDGSTWGGGNIAGWSARSGHQAVVHRGRIYVLGGDDDDGKQNDVWSSVDGTAWSLMTDNAAWSARSGHQAVVYQGRIYVLGGDDADGKQNDIWSSTDGKSWRLEHDNPAWSGRTGHQVVSYRGLLYLMGGDAATLENDLWSSGDGKSWTPQVDGGWTARAGHQAVVLPPALRAVGVGVARYVTAGIAVDGIHTFSAENGIGPYTYEMLPQVDGFAITDDGVLSSDGQIHAGDYTLTIWVEDRDGNRTQTAVRVLVVPPILPSPPPFVAFPENPRELHIFALVGGIGAPNFMLHGDYNPEFFAIDPARGALSVLADVAIGLYTLTIVAEDSATPPHQATAQAIIRIESSLEEVKQIFIFGGRVGPSGSNNVADYRNDIWSSPTGNRWTLRRANGSSDSWSRRAGLQVVMHQGTMYLFGGFISSSNNDTWSSIDGISWSLVGQTGDFGRTDHAGVSFKGRIYSLGGQNGDTIPTSDVWSTEDGKTWRLETDTPGWNQRYGADAAVHNGRIYLSGGTDYYGGDSNDIWSSSDGVNWRWEAGAIISDDEVFDSQLVSFNGRLYILGGNYSDDKNEVWSSADGRSWRAEADAPWPARAGLQAIVYNRQIYIMGGEDEDGTLYNDIWSSTDGSNWLPIDTDQVWPARTGFAALAVPPDMYIEGIGETIDLSEFQSGVLHTLISYYGAGDYSYSLDPAVPGFAVSDNGVISADGQAAAGEYTLYIDARDGELGEAETAVRVNVGKFIDDGPSRVAYTGIALSLHTFSTYRGTNIAYTIAEGDADNYFTLGEKSGILSVIAHSAEGVYELRIEAVDSDYTPPLRGVAMMTVRILGQAIFILGGTNGTEVLGDVWSSTNSGWQLLNVSAWPPRTDHQAVVYQQRLRVLDGWDEVQTTVANVWSSLGGNTWQPSSSPPGAGRYDAAAVVHQNTLYMMGGIASTWQNDVWSSADGDRWTLRGNAAWPIRGNHRAVSHNGEIFVLGGRGSSRLNDVWSSPDGQNWSERTAAANWEPREGHQAVSFRGRLYVLGGEISGDLRNDVWSSANGEIWELVKAYQFNESWAPRTDHQVIVNNNKMYILGGVDDNGDRLNDIWSSPDGSTWVEETAANWSARSGHQALVFPPNLILPGEYRIITLTTAAPYTLQAQGGVGDYTYELIPARGFAITPQEGVLSANGGVITGLNTVTIIATDRSGESAYTALRVNVPAFFDSTPTLFGFANIASDLYTFTPRGGLGQIDYRVADGAAYFAMAGNTLRISEDGKTGAHTVLIAVEDSATPPNFGTVAVTVSIRAQRIILMGGNNTDYLQDVWFGPGDWMEQDPPGWLGRSSHQVVVNNGVIYLTGGDYNGVFLNDVWSSNNGQVWQRLSDLPWTRANHQAVAHGGQIYLIGGDVGGAKSNDVWSSAAGHNWHVVTLSAGWAARSGHQSITHQGRIYLLGGETEDGVSNDLWTSIDGAVWEQISLASTAGIWSPRKDHQAISYQGSLYVLGGDDGTNDLSDVWSSADGTAWLLLTADAGWTRTEHQVVAYQGRLYLMSGSDGNTLKNDVWSSSDGAEWMIDNATAGPTRVVAQASSPQAIPPGLPDPPGLPPAPTPSPAPADGWPTRIGAQALTFPPDLRLIGPRQRLQIATHVNADLFTFTARYGAGNYTYSLPTNPNGFAINQQGVLSTDGSVDAGSYPLLVRMTDGDNATRDYRVLVDITNLTLAAVPEISALFGSGDNLHAIIARGGYGTVSYDIVGGNDEGYFTMNNNTLSVAAAARINTYTLLVAAEDQASSPNRATAMISVIIAREIYIVGGNRYENNTFAPANDVWSTIDNALWHQRKLSSTEFWSKREGHAAAWYRETLYVMGGNDGGTQNDVWSSRAGIEWSLLGNAEWSAREQHGLVVHRGQQFILGGRNGSTYNSDVWSSTDSVNWSLLTATPGWSGRYGFAPVVHNGRIYILGGRGASYFQDIWSSADGVIWVKETDAPWPSRSNHASAVHNGRIYIFGGNGSGVARNDVWSSANGRVWRQESDPVWAAREGHQAIVRDGKIYILSGNVSDTAAGDVWSSTDGQSWEEIPNNNSQWAGRENFAALLVPPELSLPGVGYELTVAKDISTDLYTFTPEHGGGGYQFSAASVNFTGVNFAAGLLSTDGNANSGHYTLTVFVEDQHGQRAQSAVEIHFTDTMPVVFDAVPRLVVFFTSDFVLHTVAAAGGFGDKSFAIVEGNEQGFFAIGESNGILSLAYQPAAGVYTLAIQATDDATTPNYGTAAVTVEVFSRQVFVLGGEDDQGRKNDVWLDGATAWELRLTNAAWSARNNHQALVHNGSIYVLGGYDGTRQNDVWQSTAGDEWQLLADNPGWSGRAQYQAVSHLGRIYILGGLDNQYNHKNDVWSSADGITWELEGYAKWKVRSGLQAVSFGGRIYIIGGRGDNNTIYNDVWSSLDGKIWQQETAAASWEARWQHQAFVYQEKIYIAGGSDDDGIDDNYQLFNDVWSSADGITWTANKLIDNSWSSRGGHQIIARDNSLLLLGGVDRNNRFNDVWSSTGDGGTWVSLAVTAGWSPRAGHQALLFPPLMNLVGSNDILLVTTGIANATLYTFTAQYGIGRYTYDINPPAEGFAVDAEGVLRVDDARRAGDYTFTVEVRDSEQSRRQVITRVRVMTTPLQMAVPPLVANGGANVSVYQFQARGGVGDKTYQIVDGNAQNYFSLNANNGVLSVFAHAEVDEYIIAVRVNDEYEPPNAITVAATIDVVYQSQQIIVLGGADDNDAGNNDLWLFTGGQSWVSLAAADWPQRRGHQALIYGQDIYVLGGENNNGGVLNDVWSSTYGRVWQYRAAEWSPRADHQALNHQGTLFVLGGRDAGDNPLADIWQLGNNGQWANITITAAWGGRTNHQAISYRGRMFVLGGFDGTNRLNDVWSSTDGKIWRLDTNNAAWSDRDGHRALVFDDTMYVIGGTDGTSWFAEVWASTDGQQWTPANTPPWAGRAEHEVVVRNSTVYIIGGTADGTDTLDDLWASTDGQNWVTVSLAATPIQVMVSATVVMSVTTVLWPGHIDHQAVVLPPDLLLFGRDGIITLTQGVAVAPLHTFIAQYGRGVYTYSLVATKGDFVINQNGVLATEGDLPGGNYGVTVVVTDEQGQRAQTPLFFDVEAPLFLADQIITVRGGSGIINTIIAEGGEGVATYTIWRGNENGYFTVNANSGVLAANTVLLAGQEFVLEIIAADSTSPQRATAQIKIIVAPLERKMYIAGGLGRDFVYRNNVISADLPGNSWGAITPLWSNAVYRTAGAIHNGKMFIVNGASVDDTPQRAIWSSADGTNWALEEPLPDGYERYGHGVVSHNGTLFVLGGNRKLNGVANDVWALTETGWNEVLPFFNNTYFNQLTGFGVVSFKGRIYVMGGHNTSRLPTRRVVSSADGVIWRLETSNPGWGNRAEFNSVVHNGKIYIAGNSSNGDMWSSENGTNWSRVANGRNIFKRAQANLLSDGSTMYYMGGVSGTEIAADVWSSSDGKEWTLEKPNNTDDGVVPSYGAGFMFPSAVALIANVNNTLTFGQAVTVGSFFATGGDPNSDPVYFFTPPHPGFQLSDKAILTADGTTPVGQYTLTVLVRDNLNFAETEVNIAVVPPPPLSLVAVDGVLNGQPDSNIHTFATQGGFGAVNFSLLSVSANNYFSINSTTGVLFANVQTPPNVQYDLVIGAVDSYTPPHHATLTIAVLIRDGQIVVLGGRNNTQYFDDIWALSSIDRQNWSQLTLGDWSPRSGHQIAVLQNTVYLIGGYDNKNFLRDIWTSNDLLHWQSNHTGTWPLRNNHQLVNNNGILYLLGGNQGNTRFNDVWQSTDGQNWQILPAAPWDGRGGHQAVSHHGQILLLGGFTNNGRQNDVWTSRNGRDWVLLTTNAPWAGRDGHQAFSAGGRVYVLGGRGNQTLLNDVWSSADGIIWRAENNAAPWTAREKHQALTYKDKFYVLGGYDSNLNRLRDLWSSGNGTNWTRHRTPQWLARSAHQAMVYPPRLRVFGGGVIVGLTTGLTVAAVHQFAARYGTGANYTYELSSVAGLAIDGDGVLSANGQTPAGYYPLTVRVTDNANNRAETAIELYVGPGLLLATPPLVQISPNTAGSIYTLSVAADFGVPIKNYEIVAGGGSDQFWVDNNGRVRTNGAASGVYVLQIVGVDELDNRGTAILTVGVRVVSTPQIYIAGGFGGNLDIWSSNNGINWSKVVSDGIINYHSAVVVFNNRIYYLGGLNGSTYESRINNLAEGDGSSLVNLNPGWSGRSNLVAFEIQGSLYVLGGRTGSNSYASDVWSSVDGINWEIQASNTELGKRAFASVVKHNGRVYIAGGLHGITYKNDVWSSDNGVNWSLETPSAEWSIRSRHEMVSHRGSLYLMGGNNGGSEVWSSPDGQSWTIRNNNAWPGRQYFGAVIFNDKIYIMGGYDGTNNLQDVWSSDDGITWNKEQDAPWSARYGFSAVTYPLQRAVTLIAADPKINRVITVFTELPTDLYTLSARSGYPPYTYGLASEVSGLAMDAQSGVLSSDGTAPPDNYQLTMQVADVAGNILSQAINIRMQYAGPQMYLLGGYDGTNRLGDVWSSVNGHIWAPESGLPFGARNGMARAIHNGRLYLVGGINELNIQSDVWSVNAAGEWRRDTDNFGMAVADHQAVSHNGTLFVLGGNTGSLVNMDDYTNMVWSSADGIMWQPRADAPWAARGFHHALVHQGRIYVLGGSDHITNNFYNDVWSSADGDHWSQETASAPWPIRARAAALSSEGKMYIIGGAKQDAIFNDVWSSVDGKIWQEIKPNNTDGFPTRHSHNALIVNNSLYVFGGLDNNNYRNDVWVSGDHGATWVSLAVAPWSPRGLAAAATYPPELFLPSPRVMAITTGIAVANLHRFIAAYGTGNYRYFLSPRVDGFDLSSDGVLSTDDTLPVGDYVLTAVVDDGRRRAQTEFRVKVDIIRVFLEDAPPLSAFAGYNTPLHTFRAHGGVGQITYNLAQNPGDYFGIGETSGVLSVRAIAPSNDDAYVVQVRAADSSLIPRDVIVAVTIIVSRGNILVLGGNVADNTTPSVRNDVWGAVDGENWLVQITAAAWSARFGHQIAPLGNTLYLFGGSSTGSDRFGDVWRSTNGREWVYVNNALGGRTNHQMIAHNGLLYVLGGNVSGLVNDVWSSADGVNWSLRTSGAGWSARQSHQAISFNSRLYVLGGVAGTNVNDVWSSPEGEVWTPVTLNAPWPARQNHQVIAQDGRLYLLGGRAGSTYYNDVWSSADGKNWQEVNATTAWRPRGGHQVLTRQVKNQKVMYVLGGYDGSNRFNDVWQSVDFGATWTSLTVAAWSARGSHQAQIFPPELNLPGLNTALTLGVPHTLMVRAQYGLPPYVYNLVNAVAGFDFSADGVLSADSDALGQFVLTIEVTDQESTDQQTAINIAVIALTLSLSEPSSTLRAVVGVDDVLYTVQNSGGYGDVTYEIVAGNDVGGFAIGQNDGVLSLLGKVTAGQYRISIAAQDGIAAPFATKNTVGVDLEIINGNIFVFGGDTGIAVKDIWRSADGKSWANLGDAAWDARYDHQMVVHHGTIYLHGGFGTYSDIWSSVDGVVWDKLSDGPGRYTHQMVSHRGSLYILGGYNLAGDNTNGVWSSADGNSWAMIKGNDNNYWSKRNSHAAVVHQGKIYVLGGSNGTTFLNDVWSSVDGAVWEKETEQADWGERNTKALSYNGRIYVVGGKESNSSAFNDVWSSVDGKTWAVVKATTAWSPRVNHQILVQNDVMYILGGAESGGNTNEVWASDDAGVSWTLRTGNRWSARDGHQALLFPPELMIAAPHMTYAPAQIMTYITVAALYGAGEYTYEINPPVSGFAILPNSPQIAIAGDNEGLFTLTVQVEDEGGRRATTRTKVQVGAIPISVSALPPLIFLTDDDALLYTIKASGGEGELTYEIAAGNDTYFSVDENNGELTKTNAAIEGVYTLSLLVYDNVPPPNQGRITVAATIYLSDDTLVVLGGAAIETNSTVYFNDLWHATADGRFWAWDSLAEWTPRRAPAVFHQGQIFVLGGDVNGGRSNEVWSSVDGAGWNLVNAAPPWSARYHHQAVAHQGRIYVLGGDDGAQRNDVWSSADGYAWRLETTTEPGWAARIHHQAVSYHGRIYILGGQSQNDIPHSDVWSSVDGKIWRQDWSDAWPFRYGHAAVVHNQQIYVLGGNDGNGGSSTRRDVWVWHNNDIDTEQWSLVQENAEWSARQWHAASSYRGELYVLGGDDGADKNDVWASVDGEKWTLRQNAAAWAARRGHQAMVLPPSLMLSGVGDIISLTLSVSGANIHQFTAQYGDGNYTYSLEDYGAGFSVDPSSGILSARGDIGKSTYIFRVTVTDGNGDRVDTVVRAEVRDPEVLSLAEVPNLLTDAGGTVTLHRFAATGGKPPLTYAVIDGDSDGYFGVGDGVLVANAAAWGDYVLLVMVTDDGGNSAATAVVSVVALNPREQMYIMGGVNSDNTLYLDDVWSSVDGANWDSVIANAPWGARTEVQVVAHRGTLYLIGGSDDDTVYDDVWSSVDGRNWTQEISSIAWTTRVGFRAVSHNDRIYLIGGRDTSIASTMSVAYLNDVWSSADGKVWGLETADANWLGRAEHGLVSHNGTLYLMGGVYYQDTPTNDDVILNDIWSSADGQTWVLVNTVSWSRSDHAAVVHGGSIYIYGGAGTSPHSGACATLCNDVWSSADGNMWANITISTGWGERGYFDGVSYKERIYLSGGNDGTTSFDDVWSSVDGAIWREDAQSKFRARSSHAMVVHTPPSIAIDGVDVAIAVGRGLVSDLHQFRARLGIGEYRYSLVSAVMGFAITPSGVLITDGTASSGTHTIEVQVEDSLGRRAMVEVEVVVGN